MVINFHRVIGALNAMLLGPHKAPLVLPAIHPAPHERAGRAGCVGQRGRLYRWPTYGGTSQRLRHLTRPRPQDGGNEIPDNGRPYGTQLSAATPRTERAVAALDPAWAFLICLDAVSEFGRSGLVALLDATVAVVRRTSGKKHQQAHRDQYNREWVHGGSFRSRECRDDCSSGSTNWPSKTPLTAAPQWEPRKPLGGSFRC